MIPGTNKEINYFESSQSTMIDDSLLVFSLRNPPPLSFSSCLQWVSRMIDHFSGHEKWTSDISLLISPQFSLKAHQTSSTAGCGLNVPAPSAAIDDEVTKVYVKIWPVYFTECYMYTYLRRAHVTITALTDKLSKEKFGGSKGKQGERRMRSFRYNVDRPI